MVTIVGKAYKDEEILGGASVQIYVRDIANGISTWLDVVQTDTGGRYQVPFDGLELHQNFSETAEILVCAWDDENERTATHAYLGSVVAEYHGEALIIQDIHLTEAGSCEYELQNNSIIIEEGDRVPYIPEFESPTQRSKFYSEMVFPQNNVTNVYVENSGEFIAPYDIIYTEAGEYIKEVRGENVSGIVFMGAVSILVTESPQEDVIELDDIVIDPGFALFSVRNRGIVDDLLTVSMFFSSRFHPVKVEFYVDNSLSREILDFSTPIVLIPTPHTDDIYRNIKMVAHGTVDGAAEEVEYTYEQTVKNFASITGSMSITYDEDTGKHTASLLIDGAPNVSEILWQIVYSSAVVEKVIRVTDEEQRALISIMYQKYTDSTMRDIEFEALQHGNYTIEAYVINTAGAIFKISENLYVPGGSGEEEEIAVGDTITIGCLSEHGEVPILSVHRLSRDGYEDVLSAPMDNAYDRTYFYDYTVEEPDSFYIFKASNSVVVKKVGSPRGCAVVYSKSKEPGMTIPYKLRDFNGDTLETGVLDDSGLGLYYKILSENAHGILIVGRTHKVI
jgi:hypothetical protein